MAEWPSIAGVDDRKLAESLRMAGGNALAQVYDSYAVRLFDYCHALLHDQEEAATAVHDVLIAAQRHSSKLRDPERFRGWLYALARNYCVHRRNNPTTTGERRAAPESDDETILDAKQRAQRKEARLVVHSALSILSINQREAADLTMRHELDPQETARVLGLSEPEATGLIEEARRSLANALSATMTARAVGKDCADATGLVGSWPITSDECKKLMKHVRTCAICGERRKRKVPTRALLQALPVARIPTDVRAKVHNTATAPELSRERLAIARQAEPFDRAGWPTHAEAAHAEGPPPRRRPRLWPAVAAAACGTFVVIAAVACLPDWGGGQLPSDGSQAAPGSGLPSDPLPSDPGSAYPEPSVPTPSRSKSPSPTPSKSQKPRPKPPAPRPQPRPTLAVAGCSMGFGDRTCAIRLTARGSTVQWRVTGSSTALSASGSGTLAPGRSTTVTVQRRGLCIGGGEGSVSFSPGGSASVTWQC